MQIQFVDSSFSALQAKFVRNQLFCVENSRIASESCFSVVGHNFQRTLSIAEALQAIRIRQQKAIWSKQAPLNDVNKLMKVHVLVVGLRRLEENSVDVSNA